ncbi:MAG: hypothetical protein ACM3N5_02675 [Candidatus Eiseniibacteriota bacterium]
MARLTGTIEEVAEQAERLLRSLVPNAHCTAQEWDNRIDCMAWLPSGKEVVGEMISINDVTEERIRETAERLKKRQLGIDVPLVNELWEPIRLIKSEK